MRTFNPGLNSAEKRAAEEWRLRKCGSLDFKELVKSFNRRLKNKK